MQVQHFAFDDLLWVANEHIPAGTELQYSDVRFKARCIESLTRETQLQHLHVLLYTAWAISFGHLGD